MNGSQTPALLTARSLSKSYGSVRALRSVSAEFYPGEIHAVLGENGAGKSTLMGVFGGFVVPDEGEVRLRGKLLPLGDPTAVRKLGVRMIHQHFMLVPNLTVRENFALAQISGKFGPIDCRNLISGAVTRGRELGWDIDLEARVGELAVGVQQRIEILKALSGDAHLVMLDEPTAVLSPTEIAELFVVLRRVADAGAAVILIAHKLSEVLANVDRVTVLRRGEFVASQQIEGTTAIQLEDWMMGERSPRDVRSSGGVGEVAIRASRLTARDDRGIRVVNGVDIEVCRGEIFGIGGVDGNGQVELAEVLAGVRECESGTVEIEGSVAYIPQDRQHDGLALGMSIEENLVLAAIPKELTRGAFLSPSLIREHAEQLIDEFEIKARSAADRAGSLSGGNQQKIVVARTLSGDPGVIIAVNPTRGLDIRAARYVRGRLQQAAANGAAIVLFSTDLDELAEMGDTTFYMSRGRVGTEFLGSEV